MSARIGAQSLRTSPSLRVAETDIDKEVRLRGCAATARQPSRTEWPETWPARSAGLAGAAKYQAAKAGGEKGIRTLGRISPTHAFQACSFNHSDISPYI